MNLTSQPINIEAKSLIVSLKQRKYTNEEINTILIQLGYESTPRIVQNQWRIYEERKQSKQKKETKRAPPFMLNSEKIKQMTYLFLNNQEMTVNKASKLFGIGKQQIRRYLIQFGIGCTKGKGQKFERYTFKKFNRKKLTSSEIEEIENEELQKRLNRPLIQEPSPIDPQSLPLWKKIEMRIIFPKIRYGQVHQWERYYDRLINEVKLNSLKFLDFKRGEKFTGKGCYIYILSEYDQNVFLDNFTLEKFLETSLPEDFFAGNCLNTNKIRVFDYPYIPQNIPQEDIINLNDPNVEEIFKKVNNKIKNMNEQEQQQLNNLALQIHQQYQKDTNKQFNAANSDPSMSEEEADQESKNILQIDLQRKIAKSKFLPNLQGMDIDEQNQLLFKEMDQLENSQDYQVDNMQDSQFFAKQEDVQN
ncbi:hypothetical protein ABPG72_008015 [Tetrahymena utriculariae]